MCLQCHVDMRDSIARGIGPARHSCLESLQRFLAPVHARIGDRQTKAWSTGELSCLFVERNCLVEAPHLAIQRSQQRLAIVDKCRVKLQRAFASRDRFIVKTEVTVELTSKIADPQ